MNGGSPPGAAWRTRAGVLMVRGEGRWREGGKLSMRLRPPPGAEDTRDTGTSMRSQDQVRFLLDKCLELSKASLWSLTAPKISKSLLFKKI